MEPIYREIPDQTINAYNGSLDQAGFTPEALRAVQERNAREILLRPIECDVIDVPIDTERYVIYVPNRVKVDHTPIKLLDQL